jgi:SAM-dependent methyltransferase
MHPSLLQRLRCPACGGALEKSSEEELRCAAGVHRFPIEGGAPRFVNNQTDTARNFGYMWGRQTASARSPDRVRPYHLHSMLQALEASPLQGLVMDAGCGEGLDLAMAALDPSIEVVGVELSSGGVATSLARTRGMENAHVVQGDLQHLPMADSIFDAAYSYGVVHHTQDPARAVVEIARTLKPGGWFLMYVYEDFCLALTIANSPRFITTRMPPPALMALCRALSPVVFALCTWPSRRFSWASRFPYRHGTGVWSLSGDLYDRFSAPIEKRFSREGATSLVSRAGLEVVRVAQRRGWMVLARRRT